MTHPGFPPPLSTARREQQAARVTDLRAEMDDMIANLDRTLDQELAAGRRRHPSAYVRVGAGTAS